VQVASDLGTAWHNEHLMVVRNAKRENAVMKQGREESMNRRRKCDEMLYADSTTFAALLIGRSLRSETISCVGGVAKEKYTTPHDFALR
jgi:23S rRNA maturation mini-RNase III